MLAAAAAAGPAAVRPPNAAAAPAAGSCPCLAARARLSLHHLGRPPRQTPRQHRNHSSAPAAAAAAAAGCSLPCLSLPAAGNDSPAAGQQLPDPAACCCCRQASAGTAAPCWAAAAPAPDAGHRNWLPCGLPGSSSRARTCPASGPEPGPSREGRRASPPALPAAGRPPCPAARAGSGGAAPSAWCSDRVRRSRAATITCASPPPTRRSGRDSRPAPAASSEPGATQHSISCSGSQWPARACQSSSAPLLLPTELPAQLTTQLDKARPAGTAPYSAHCSLSKAAEPGAVWGVPPQQ